jgi:hypothetical protein
MDLMIIKIINWHRVARDWKDYREIILKTRSTMDSSAGE